MIKALRWEDGGPAATPTHPARFRTHTAAERACGGDPANVGAGAFGHRQQAVSVMITEWCGHEPSPDGKVPL
ncbi:MAG: hypothetical protein ACRDWI_13645 [Jiangellaceae bacterium]